MSPILLCWLTTSEVAVGDMEVEGGPPCQYSIIFCCVWQMAAEAQSDKMTSNVEVHMKQRRVTESPPAEKCHPRTFVDTCWTLMETQQWMWAQWGGAFQQWWQWQWVTSTGVDFYKSGMQGLVHCWWKCIACGGNCWKIVFCSWEFALSNSGFGLFISVVISMEIHRRH